MSEMISLEEARALVLSHVRPLPVETVPVLEAVGRVAAADLGSLLPDELANGLRTGLAAFGRKLRGYDAPDTLLTGLETRTSSPVRLVRGEELECLALPGLYPCGEGAGYAGGIMSAAVDGLRVARAIVQRFAPVNEL